MLFYHNNSKYANYYFSIIEKAKTLNRSKKEDYFENHHIHPECLGGTRDKSNMVLLTAREHLICHRLLVRMFDEYSVEWCSMVFAFKRMIDYGKKQPGRADIISSRHYEERRRNSGRAMKIILTGRKHTEKSKKQMSKSHKGKILSAEQKIKISQSLKETLSLPEFKLKMTKRETGKIHSEQRKLKTSENMKKVWAKRNSIKTPIQKPGQNTPEEIKLLWKLRISFAQKGKLKPIIKTPERTLKTSEAMKLVWSKRRLQTS